MDKKSKARPRRAGCGLIKVTPALVLAGGLAIPMTGCNDRGKTGNQIERIKESPAKYYGKEVSLAGEVHSLKGPRSFKIESSDLFDEEILVLARSDIRLGSESLDPGDRVRVTGTVRPLSTVEVERELGWDLDPQLEIEFNSKPIVVARSVALVDRPNLSWNETPRPAVAITDPFGLRPGEALWIMGVERLPPSTPTASTTEPAKRAAPRAAGSPESADAKSAGQTVEEPAPAGEPTTAAMPAQTTDDRAMAAASLDKEKTAGRVVDWSPVANETRPLVTLYVVKTGENQGVLRARQGDQRRDIETFRLQPGSTPELEVKTLGTGTALFRYSPASGASERNQRVVLLLAWDGQDRRVEVLKRWRGGMNQPEPAWLETGKLTAGATELGKCAKVVRKISRCAKDPKFMNALFHDLAGTERQRAQDHLTSQAPGWAKPEAAHAQCERWAGPGYIDTHFSDPEELNELVKDTKLDCNFFGREIDDEGGLPQPVAQGSAAPGNAL